MSAVIDHPSPVRRVGRGRRNHFFGYYNKPDLDPAQNRRLAHATDSMTGDLTGAEIAEVGYFEGDDAEFVAIGRTRAWNWQMGSQVQWLGGTQGGCIVYNARRPDAGPAPEGDPLYCAVVHDLASGTDRLLPAPVYVVEPDGAYALCVDYCRLATVHPTIGYADAADPARMPPAPEAGGIHRMDMATGERRLIVSLDRLRHFRPLASMEGAIHWVTHLEIAPSGRRFLFLHRWTRRIADETCWLHRLYSCDSDGGDLRLLECSDHPLPQLAETFDPEAVGTFDYEKSEYQISHPAWRDDRHIIVWGPHAGRIAYHLYEDADDGAVTALGVGTLVENGHMSYGPDRRWLLSDTYPDSETNVRHLFVYDTEAGTRHDVAQFWADRSLGKENRCDLHPRWSRDGLSAAVDSVHDGMRQIYRVDLAPVIGGRSLR